MGSGSFLNDLYKFEIFKEILISMRTKKSENTKEKLIKIKQNEIGK